MEYIFESERLGFRNWKDEDFVYLYNICSNSEVMRFFPNILNRDETKAFYNKIINHTNKKGFGLWVVELKDTGEFIGFIGLLEVSFQSDFTPCIEIGWRLDNRYWNKGYGTEGAKRVLEYAFNNLKLDKIYSFTAEINKPSENIMKKIGMDKVKCFDHPNVEEGSILKRHVLYIIENEIV